MNVDPPKGNQNCLGKKVSDGAGKGKNKKKTNKDKKRNFFAGFWFETSDVLKGGHQIILTPPPGLPLGKGEGGGGRIRV